MPQNPGLTFIDEHGNVVAGVGVARFSGATVSGSTPIVTVTPDGGTGGVGATGVTGATGATGATG